MDNEHGITCEKGCLSDNESYRLVLRFADNALFLEGFRTELKEKPYKEHYFLIDLTPTDLFQLKETAEKMLDWIRNNS